MKRLILSSLLFLGLSVAYSQTKPAEQLTCLDQYKKVFKERGADRVADGMHRNVIVSIEDEYGTNCFYGKARVEAAKVTAIFIKFEDETYELFEGQDFTVPYGTLIKNGITDPWVTKADKQKMTVIFVESIKPKKKKYKQAPGPDPSKL